MKRIALIIYLTLCTTMPFSQEIKIEGVVLDSLKNPISYANVGILNKSVGTVTNENGEFSLRMKNSFISEILKISSIGYEPQEFRIKELLNQKAITVQLATSIELLDEIVIRTKHLKTYTKGKTKTKNTQIIRFAIPQDGDMNVGSEMGRKFSLGTKKTCYLEDFKFFIRDNNFTSLVFRVNLYRIKDDKPSRLINKTNILAKVENHYTGWVNVDLADYDIAVQDDIIATVQWVEGSDDGNKLNSSLINPSFFTAPMYYRYGTQNKFRKDGGISLPMTLTYKK